MGFERNKEENEKNKLDNLFENDDATAGDGDFIGAQAVKAPKRSIARRAAAERGNSASRAQIGTQENAGSASARPQAQRPVQKPMMRSSSEFGYLFSDDEPIDTHMDEGSSRKLDGLAYNEKNDGDGAQYESLFSGQPNSMVRKHSQRYSAPQNNAPAQNSEQSPAASESTRARFARRNRKETPAPETETPVKAEEQPAQKPAQGPVMPEGNDPRAEHGTARPDDRRDRYDERGRYSDRYERDRRYDDRYDDRRYNDRYDDRRYNDRYDDRRYNDRYDDRYNDRYDDRYDDRRYNDRYDDYYDDRRGYDGYGDYGGQYYPPQYPYPPYPYPQYPYAPYPYPQYPYAPYPYAQYPAGAVPGAVPGAMPTGYPEATAEAQATVPVAVPVVIPAETADESAAQEETAEQMNEQTVSEIEEEFNQPTPEQEETASLREMISQMQIDMGIAKEPEEEDAVEDDFDDADEQPASPPEDRKPSGSSRFNRRERGAASAQPAADAGASRSEDTQSSDKPSGSSRFNRRERGSAGASSAPAAGGTFVQEDDPYGFGGGGSPSEFDGGAASSSNEFGFDFDEPPAKSSRFNRRK